MLSLHTVGSILYYIKWVLSKMTRCEQKGHNTLIPCILLLVTTQQHIVDASTVADPSSNL